MAMNNAEIMDKIKNFVEQDNNLSNMSAYGKEQFSKKLLDMHQTYIKEQNDKNAFEGYSTPEQLSTLISFYVSDLKRSNDEWKGQTLEDFETVKQWQRETESKNKITYLCIHHVVSPLNQNDRLIFEKIHESLRCLLPAQDPLVRWKFHEIPNGISLMDTLSHIAHDSKDSVYCLILIEGHGSNQGLHVGKIGDRDFHEYIVAYVKALKTSNPSLDLKAIKFKVCCQLDEEPNDRRIDFPLDLENDSLDKVGEWFLANEIGIHNIVELEIGSHKTEIVGFVHMRRVSEQNLGQLYPSVAHDKTKQGLQLRISEHRPIKQPTEDEQTKHVLVLCCCDAHEATYQPTANDSSDVIVRPLSSKTNPKTKYIPSDAKSICVHVELSEFMLKNFGIYEMIIERLISLYTPRREAEPMQTD